MNAIGFKRVMFTIAYPLAIAMLVLWAIVTFAFSGPGWIHLFLSLGVFLLIWRIVAGGTSEAWRKHQSKR